MKGLWLCHGFPRKNLYRYRPATLYQSE